MTKENKVRRVAYLINQYPKGSHTFIRREILELERIGFEVSRISYRGWSDSTVVDPADLSEVKKTFFTMRNRSAGILEVLGFIFSRPVGFFKGIRLALEFSKGSRRNFLYHVAMLYHVVRVIKCCERKEVHHLHAHFGTNTAEVATMVGSMSSISYSFTVHGAEEFYDLRDTNFNLKIEGASFVAAITCFCRSQIFLAIHPSLWPKIKIVHCGLDESFLATDVKSISGGDSNHTFISVGRIAPEKGPIILLEAFNEFLKMVPDAELIFAGDGPLRSVVEARISELCIEKHVKILGWISSDEVRAQIQKSRALVSASFAEGLPVVFMEAFSVARPVIATAIAGTPELVDQRCGWLVPASSRSNLVNALSESCELSSDEILELGLEGRKRVLERHSIKTEVQKLSILFEEFGRVEDAK